MTSRKRDRPALFSPTERLVAWMVGVLLAAGLLILFLWNFVFVRILPGEVGVRYSLLFGGTDVETVLPEGFALKLPWDRIYIYEVRVQQLPFELHALSAEGMSISILGNLLYRPSYQDVGRLQKRVGPAYRERLVDPVAVASVREIMAQYNSHELYSIKYDRLRDEILEKTRAHPAASVVEFVDLLIRAVVLPEEVTQAIEQKLAQEQLAASYEFRLLAQKQEAERRRIEAIGIQTFYAIVSEALNDTLLTWRGIEATVQLSKSPNTKIVIVGGSKDQMPLILGSEITRQPAGPSALKAVPPAEQVELPDWSTLPWLFPEIEDDVNSRGARPAAILRNRRPNPEDALPTPSRRALPRSQDRSMSGGASAQNAGPMPPPPDTAPTEGPTRP